MKKRMLKTGQADRCVLALCLVACLVTAALVYAVLPPGRSVDIHVEDGDVRLSLPGIQDATYDIQAKTSLTNDWQPLETVTGLAGETFYPLAPDSSPSRFFRIMFPQPSVTAGEPAFAPATGGTTVYVTGNYFYEGDQIFVDGVRLSNVTFISSTLLSGTLPTLSPGLHTIEVVEYRNGDSLALASLPNALEVAPSLERTLQGPPAWPPAGPARSRSAVVRDVTAPRPLAGLTYEGQWGDPHENIAAKAPASTAVLVPDLPRKGSTYVRAPAPDSATMLQSRGTDDDCSGPPDHSRVGRLDTDSDDDGIMDLLLHAGEVEQQVVDLAVPGRGLDFVWARTYRSRTGAATAQGNRWSHSYDVRCVQSSVGIDLYDGTGRKDTFRLQANGTYTCPEFFREGTLTTNVFRLAFADTGYWEFHPFDDASPASGKLARIVDRHGNTMTLDYDGAGRLVAIVDDLGRTHTVAYNPAGQVASVSDFSGRTVAYTYYSAGDSDGRPGDLKSVTSPPVTGTSTSNDFPSGKTTTYSYSTNAATEAGGLLLSITDALGQTTMRCAYDLDSTSPSFARCVSVQRGTHAPTRITYLPQTPAPDNRFAALRCIVNDPEGNVSEYDFDSRNRCVALREFTGRAAPGQPVTDIENRPAGKLRADDPDVFETTWSWNNDSLCTAWQRPLTNRIEWVYQADLDPAAPPRQRGNLREERRVATDDLDGDGRQDVTLSRFEHDPRFGRDPSPRFTAKFVDGRYVLRAGARRKLWLPSNFRVRHSSSGAIEGCDGRDDDCDGVVDEGFVTRAINPLGFETRGEYDANGNLVTLTRHAAVVYDVTPPALARDDFEFNAHGQVTAHVHAEDGDGRRRRDEYAYYASGAPRGYLQQVVVDAGATGRNLTTRYEYDARGNVTRCVDPRGTPTDIEVNALNQAVAKQTQGASFGEKVRALYSYDAANNLVQVDVENRDGDGTLDPTNAWLTTQFEYDDLHRLTRLIEEEGVSVSLTNEFVYDGNDRLVLARSPLAVQGGDPFHVTQNEYDERGLLFRETRAPGSPSQTTTQCDYDANGNLRALRCGLEDGTGGRVTQTAYDGFDRCVSATDPMGNETRYEYDANGNRTRATVYGEMTDAPGGADNQRMSETRYTYDELDRCVQTRDAFFDVVTQAPLGDGGRDTTLTYAPNGLIVATTNDRGHGTTYTFDTTLFLTGIVDAKTNRVEYTYDANGNVLSATETGRSDLGGPDEVFVRGYAHDALDRCVADWDNLGSTNHYAYDSRGNLVRHTDPLGFSLEGDFDGLSRPTSNRQGVGGSAQTSTRYAVDAASRRVASTDGNTNTTEYVYDSLDRLVRATLADGTSVTNVYDVHGNLVWTRDANGTEIARVYDALDRCIQKNITPGAGVASNTTLETYQYDGMSRLVRAVNDHTEVIREYDSLGRCVRESTSSPALGFNYEEIKWTYDAHGLTLAQTNPSGRIVEYSYDALDRPVSLDWRSSAAEPRVPLAAFAYSGPDRLVRITRANGVQTDYTYSGLNGVAHPPGDFGWGQLQRVRHTSGGAAAIDERLFAYDRSQNKTLRSLTEPFGAGGWTNRQEFVYDSLDRLVQSVTSTNGTIARNTAYALDPMGNRLSVMRDGVNSPYTLDPTLPVPGDFQVNQYTDTPFDARQYDENGNLKRTVFGDPASPATNTFIYDYADRLVAVQGSSGPVATYAYDALGRRIAKVVYDGLPPVPALTNRYLYADGRLIEEEDGRGAVQRTFVMPHVFERSDPSRVALDGTRSFDDGGIRGFRATVLFEGSVVFNLCDDQDSLLALTDEEGHVIERFDYDDYGAPSFLDANGNPRTDATAPLTDVRQLFQGMQWDEATGLYVDGDDPSPYMNKGELIDAIAKDAGLSRCRYFDPNTGRTLSRAYDDDDRLPGMNKAELIDAMAKEAGFSSRKRAARTGRNPQTGKEIKIAAKKVAKFKAGKALADTVK